MGFAIPSLIERFRTPAVSVAVVNNNKIDWASANGLSDVEAHVAAETSHLFAACSMSKFIAALAVMSLAQDGLVDLDADVNNMLRSWKLAGKAWAVDNPVTLRMLLNHTAGIIDADGSFDRLPPGEPPPSLLDVLLGQTQVNRCPISVTARPGNFVYSDGGYCVVEQIIEDVTGRRFAQVAFERVLGPLSMADSLFEQPLGLEHADRVALGYNPDGVLGRGEPVYPFLAAAGLWSTATDMAKAMIEVGAALTGRGQILTQQSAKDIIAHRLGLFASPDAEGTVIFSLGWGHGFQCELVGCPDRGQGAVVMTNSNPEVHQSKSIVGEILRTLGAEYGWPGF